MMNYTVLTQIAGHLVLGRTPINRLDAMPKPGTIGRRHFFSRVGGASLGHATLILSCVGALVLAVGAAKAEESKPERRPAEGIQDNSFLIEEAYNQEPGVVQHIFTGRYGVDHHPGDQTRGWDLGFTQEWPMWSQTHQLSYTIPYGFIDPPDAEHDSGLGDIALNYRYQLRDGSDGGAAIAPRISLLFPSGDDDRGFGSGALGYQFNLPMSYVADDRLTFHLNAGFTHVPNAELLLSNGRHSDELDLLSFNLGGSAIYAVTPDFNVLVELVWNSEQGLDEDQRSSREQPYADRGRLEEVVISPGVRWAINLDHDLQIVPGVAVPIGLTDDAIDYGVFFYFSIEHPFGATGR